MNCLDIRTLATEYLEVVLPPKDHSAFERHLRECDRCQEWFESLQETIAGLRCLATDDLTPEVEQVLLERFRKSKPRQPKLVPDPIRSGDQP